MNHVKGALNGCLSNSVTSVLFFHYALVQFFLETWDCVLVNTGKRYINETLEHKPFQGYAFVCLGCYGYPTPEMFYVSSTYLVLIEIKGLVIA